MAETVWRCSQCGAINDPGSRACQGCGKWPSLFDLQDGVADEATPEELESAFEFREPEPEMFEPETFEPERDEADRGEPDESEPVRNPRWRLLRSVIVPLAVAVYLVISALADR
jgi:predicted ATP-dependent serine protease